MTTLRYPKDTFSKNKVLEEKAKLGYTEAWRFEETHKDWVLVLDKEKMNEEHRTWIRKMKSFGRGF